MNYKVRICNLDNIRKTEHVEFEDIFKTDDKGKAIRAVKKYAAENGFTFQTTGDSNYYFLLEPDGRLVVIARIDFE